MTQSDPQDPDLAPFSFIDINLIQISRDTRQRREIETSDLQQSIAQLGLLQPPVVRRHDYRLMAGERRLEACRVLGWQRVPVRWFEGLEPLEAELVELAENIKRKALPWQDEARALGRIYQLQGDGTTQQALAEAVGVTQGYVAKVLRVCRDLEEEKISKASSVAEAYNILARRDQRAAGEAMEELLGLSEPQAKSLPQQQQQVPALSEWDEAAPVSEAAYQSLKGEMPSGTAVISGGCSSAAVWTPPAPLPPSSPIQCASFLDWLRYDAPKLTQKFNFVHCDFPYGLELFQSQQGRGAEPGQGYADSEDHYFQLLQQFCTHFDSFGAMSCHLMFWFSAKHRERTMQMFKELCPSLIFYPYDLIWHKSDNAGIAGDYRRHPRHTYEQALLATRSSRNILQIVADSYAGPTDKRLHPSCKPEPMLRHFFQMFVDAQARVFDPTCGSGSSLRAANSLGATQLLGLEIDPQVAELAQREYRLRARSPG